MDGLICKWGVILELLTALPTSCPADQSQSYSSAGSSSGDAVKGRRGLNTKVGGWGDGGCLYVERPKFEKDFIREMRL